MMNHQQKNSSHKPEDAKPADTGNASNPSPGNKAMEPENNNQLLSEGAEKYLREAGNIEDLPDANDQQGLDSTMKEK